MFVGYGKYLPLVCDMNRTDAEVERLIDQACQEAAEEIRSYLLIQRRVEADSQQRKRELAEEQHREVAETLAHREREAEASRRRHEQLKTAEQLPPQKRTRLWNG